MRCGEWGQRICHTALAVTKWSIASATAAWVWCIKPANVMVDGEGVLKILDFGIARIGDSSLTQAGVMIGTPNYMSPEQIDGRPVDRRSDIFAVGLVFYELLTYRQAFPGQGAIPVMHAILHAAPASSEQVSPGIHPNLQAIVE